MPMPGRLCGWRTVPLTPQEGFRVTHSLFVLFVCLLWGMSTLTDAYISLSETAFHTDIFSSSSSQDHIETINRHIQKESDGNGVMATRLTIV
jgi:hypothetical protein